MSLITGQNYDDQVRISPTGDVIEITILGCGPLTLTAEAGHKIAHEIIAAAEEVEPPK